MGTDTDNSDEEITLVQAEETPPVDNAEAAALAFLQQKYGISRLADLDQMRQKAAHFDRMDNDPGLAEVVNSYYNGPKPQETQEPESTMTNPDFAKLEARLTQFENVMRQQVARQQVADFKATHPDFDQYKEPLKNLLQKYPDMTLDDAYEFVSTKNQRAQASPTTPVSRPTGGVEMQESAANPRASSRDELEARINDPKLSFEEAIQLAAFSDEDLS